MSHLKQSTVKQIMLLCVLLSAPDNKELKAHVSTHACFHMGMFVYFQGKCIQYSNITFEEMKNASDSKIHISSQNYFIMFRNICKQLITSDQFYSICRAHISSFIHLTQPCFTKCNSPALLLEMVMRYVLKKAARGSHDFSRNCTGH